MSPITTSGSARHAVYFCPPQESLLSSAAEQWLGYSAWKGVKVAHSPMIALLPDLLFQLTEKPANYGFHATLRAPMRLADDCDEVSFQQAVSYCANGLSNIEIDRLVLRWIGRFLALVPEKQSDELVNFANEIVTQLDAFRAALSDEEIERRKPAALSANQRQLLSNWGYPYVGNEFQFHMTLTGPVAETQRDLVEDAARAYFAEHIDQPLLIDQLVVSKQDTMNSTFQHISAHPLNA